MSASPHGRWRGSGVAVNLAIRLVALAGALVAAAMLMAMGAFLVAFDESGARVVGGVLVAIAAALLAAVLYLVRVSDSRFAGSGGSMRAIAAASVGGVPLAVLALIAMSFAGLPIGSRTPLLDWAILTIGMFFAVGAACVALLAWLRLRAVAQPTPLPPSIDDTVTDWETDIRVTRLSRPASE
jgi:hypothetical protein